MLPYGRAKNCMYLLTYFDHTASQAIGTEMHAYTVGFVHAIEMPKYLVVVSVELCMCNCICVFLCSLLLPLVVHFFSASRVENGLIAETYPI